MHNVCIDNRGHYTYPSARDPERFADTATLLARENVTTYIVSDAGGAPGLSGGGAPDYAVIAAATGGRAFNTLNGNFANDLQLIANEIVSQVSTPEQFVVEQGGLQIQVGPNEGQMIGINRYHINSTRMGLTSVNVERFSDFEDNFIGDGAAKDVAYAALETDILGQIDLTLDRLATIRAHYGSVQNRLEYTVNNLSITNENIMASRSRIMDTDYANETANLTKLQILQQAGTAVISQANIAPQSALSLLGS